MSEYLEDRRGCGSGQSCVCLWLMRCSCGGCWRAAGLRLESMEWDHDVPPFPIFIGEVARAEATLTFQARRRYRRLAA